MDYVSNPSTCACDNNTHLKSIVDDLVATCDEIIVMSVPCQ